MVAGYAAFQTNLKINGTSGISSNWDIKITNVTESNKEGEAETVGTPSWTNLTAYMEASLYQKGDFVEYDVTVENRGTLDAKLESITDNIKSSNEAVKITFSGYTKGEKLEKGQSQIIKVKIEYNPDFTGTPEEGSGEVSIDLNYTQNDGYAKDEGGDIISPDRYLVTYDCMTNGGKDCSSFNEYLKEGETVNLLYQGTNNSHKFIGWNTDKDAEEVLTELQMEAEDVTLYAIYEKDPIIRSWASTDTTDFHSEAYKQSIISVEFLDNRNIPENAVESFDVSDKNDKSVMAWVIPDTIDNTKHHLYIGGDGGVIANEDSSYLFFNFTNIQSIEFNDNFDTSNVTDMSGMFQGTNNLLTLNLNHFNTSKVTNMSAMFSMWNNVDQGNSSGKMTELDVSNFDTSNVINMRSIFAHNTSLTSIKGLENFNTNKLVDMQGIFYRCFKINKLNLCSFNTKNATNMTALFAQTSSLEKVYVGPNWVTANATTTNMWTGSKISAVTQSNNCMIDAENPATLSFTTSKTTKSITVVATATSESGIAKYEYSKDGGSTWVTGSGNTYTFSGLKNNTSYNIKVRVTSKIGKQTTSESSAVTTNNIATPTFSDNTAQTQVTINFPSGCGSTYTCTYKYNDAAEVTTTNSSTTITKNASGNIVAKVTDGTNTVSSSYIVLYNNIYISSSGNDSTGYGTTAKPYATLNKAYTMATESASIKVMDNITVNETTKLDENKTITLTSYSEDNSANSVIKGKVLNDHFLMATQGTLSLENIVLDGNNLQDTSAGISMGEGTKINLNNNSIVQNFKNTSASGGGVRARKNVIVNINGGVIRNNEALYDAGLQTGEGSTINFSSGEISSNKATSSTAAGIAVNGGTLTMTGGKIMNNEASTNAGGIYVGNSDSLVGKAYISGGTISNNKAGLMGGGMYVSGSSSNKTILEISGNTLIDNNRAERFGGGIRIIYGTFTMKSGTISNNSTNIEYYASDKGNWGDGGAINMAYSTMDMSGGTITKNQGRNGMAISVFSNSTFNMTGGTISNNTGNMGAICLFAGGQFTLNGGGIKNNTATVRDGGISIDTSVSSNKYTYKSGTVCGNRPTNSYERSTNC